MKFHFINFFVNSPKLQKSLCISAALLISGCATLQKTISSQNSTSLEEIHYQGSFFEPVPFIKHEDSRPFKSYVAINVNHKPTSSLREALEKNLKKGLVRRNESHITVITPPEVELLSSCLSIQELSQLAIDQKLQQSSFKISCVGEGSVKGVSKTESTYFLVVESEAAYKFRAFVKQKCSEKTEGKDNTFNPDLYYPHITIGFTSRDLHIEDGVLKGPQTCKYKAIQD